MASKEFWTPWAVETINEIVWNPSSPSAKRKYASKGKEKVKLASVPPTDKGDVVSLEGKDGSEQSRYFFDYEVPILPEKILASVLEWKRPNELYPDVSAEELSRKVVIYSGKDYELHQYNQHLQASSYYNHIIDVFESMRLYEDFEKADFQGFGFTTWKPTNHIYAMTTVKKGEPHQVQVNPYGKYIIRLYHCGKWRQIQVDDRIPVDYGNKVLLPCIYTGDELELWPMLISKAILKLNLHHSYDDGHYYIDQKATHQCRLYDGEKCLCKDYIPVRKHYLYSETQLTRMNALHLLTGWYPEEYEFSGKRSEHVWDSFQKFLPQFLYPNARSQLKLNKPAKGKKKGSRSDDGTIDTIETAEVREPHPLVTLDVMLQPIKNTNRNLFMEINCLLYRNVPLDESTEEISNGLPLWKTYRWMYWAAERGIWKPDMQKMFWSVLCSIPECRHKHFKLLFEQEWLDQVNQLNQKQLEILSTTEINKSLREQKSNSSGMKKQKSGVMKKGKSKEPIEKAKEDQLQPKVWIGFKQLLTVLECMKFYHKDHNFRTNIFISNEDPPSNSPLEPVPSKTLNKPPKKGKQKQSTGSVVRIDAEASFQRVFGEEGQPLYMFVDQESDTDVLMDLTVLMSECHPNEAEVKIERYRWNCLKQQLVTELVSTCLEGCRMSLRKGRSAYKITFRAKGFCFHIRSNSPNIKIIDKDTLLECMATDSILFDSYIQKIMGYARRYAESVGEPDFPENRYDFFQSLVEYFIDGTQAEIREYILQNVQISLFNLVRKNPGTSRTLRRFLIATDPIWTFTLTPATLGKTFLRTVKKWQEAKKLQCDCPGVKPAFSAEQEQEIRKCAALKIQSFMKMLYVRQLLRYHDPNEPNRKYCDQLKRDIKNFFNKYCTNQPDAVKNFIISFLFHSRLKVILGRLMIPFDPNTRFAEFFEFYEDFHFSVRKVLKTHEVPPGAQAGKWYPLKTGCLFCHSEKIRRYMIRVKSNPDTPKITFFVKILNNDDLKMVAKSELVSMWPLHQNKYGYKVFIFMFVSADPIAEPVPVLPLSWIVEVISPKHAPFAHFCNFCNDTMCPCDQPSGDPAFFPLACTDGELQDFAVFSNVQECSAEVGALVKYLIKVRELVCMNIFMSSSCDLSEFEVKVVQTVTRRIVASQADSKVAMIGLYLRPMASSGPQHKSTDFSVTISWLRRARIGSQASCRSSETTIEPLKFGEHGQNISGVQSVADADRITIDVKIAYDKGANVEVIAIEPDNPPYTV